MLNPNRARFASESNLKVKYNLAKVDIKGSSPFFRLKTNYNLMSTDIFLFYFFSGFAIISSLMVITLSNAVHSVLFLIIVFCNVSALLLLMGAEFFSFMFLIIYVGAIAVLFLFVVMMLNVKKSTIKINKFSTLPVGLIIFCILTIQLVNLIDDQFTLLNYYTLTYKP